MFKKTLIVVIIAVCMDLNAATAKYASIKIEGLVLLSKKFLLSSGAVVQTDKGYIVDKEMLSFVIKKEKMIKEYKLIDKNNTLWINVIEKRPVLRILAINSEVTRALEIDASLQITSLDAVYLLEAPTVMIHMTDLSAGVFKGRSREFLRKLIAQKEAYSVWNEISSIDIRGESDIIIMLRNRPTSVVCGEDSFSLKRIHALVGYMDKVNYYPEMIHIEGAVAVIK